jgi:hypothetical protein
MILFSTMNIDLLLAIIAGGLALLGIVLTSIGIVWWKNVRHFVQSAEHAEGTVIELIESRGGKGGYTYSPVVEFADRFGQRHEHRSSMGSNPPRFSVGDKVQIVYDQNDLDSAKINHWLHLYFAPFLVLFFAVDFIIMAVILFIVARFIV